MDEKNIILAIVWTNSIFWLRQRINNVEERTAGKMENIPPQIGPPVFAISTAPEITLPAKIARRTYSLNDRVLVIWVIFWILANRFRINKIIGKLMTKAIVPI
jgi:hypothetical protein